jgi:hypothetical protein
MAEVCWEFYPVPNFRRIEGLFVVGECDSLAAETIDDP